MDQEENLELVLMSGMTDGQRQLFLTRMVSTRKNPTIALLLTLFLGGVGAHHFYLGKIGLGVCYVALCFTLLPVIFSLFELAVIRERVAKYNAAEAQRIASLVSQLPSTSRAAVPS